MGGFCVSVQICLVGEYRPEKVVPIFGHDVQRAFILETARRRLHDDLPTENHSAVFRDSLCSVGIFTVEGDRCVIASGFAESIGFDEIVAADEQGAFAYDG